VTHFYKTTMNHQKRALSLSYLFAAGGVLFELGLDGRLGEAVGK
jgi:hypothetical protein